MTPGVVVEDLSKLSIIEFPDPRLELVADLIPVEGQDAAKKLADRMLELMLATGIGWGLAATQVAVPWRLFVMQIPKVYAGEPKRWVDPVRGTPFVFANPVIMRESETIVPLNEGCLSFPGVQQRIERPESVELYWTDVHTWTPKGQVFSGWEARVIQHEVEHLNGVNLINHLLPAAQKKMRKRALAGRRL